MTEQQCSSYSVYAIGYMYRLDAKQVAAARVAYCMNLVALSSRLRLQHIFFIHVVVCLSPLISVECLCAMFSCRDASIAVTIG